MDALTGAYDRMCTTAQSVETRHIVLSFCHESEHDMSTFVCPGNALTPIPPAMPHFSVLVETSTCLRWASVALARALHLATVDKTSVSYHVVLASPPNRLSCSWQNGGAPAGGEATDSTERYIRNARDLARLVATDTVYT